MQFIQKPFEIPYNFDINLINFLKIYKPFDLHCIYLPPFGDDYPYSAKYNTLRKAKSFMQINFPDDRQDYEQHVKYIRESFPQYLMLLLQSNEKIMPIETLKYYLDLGFTKFCVGTIEQAQLIKELAPTAEIIGSITMKIEPDILYQDLQTYKKYFDCFVLWFPFNRDLDRINHLPKCFKYSLLINCGCTIKCDGTHHWFIQESEENAQFYCPKKYNPQELNKYKNIVLLRPDHLYLFDKYITYFKLQGREYPTEKIIQDIVMFTTNFTRYDLFEPYDVKDIFKFPQSKYYPQTICH